MKWRLRWSPPLNHYYPDIILTLKMFVSGLWQVMRPGSITMIPGANKESIEWKYVEYPQRKAPRSTKKIMTTFFWISRHTSIIYHEDRLCLVSIMPTYWKKCMRLSERSVATNSDVVFSSIRKGSSEHTSCCSGWCTGMCKQGSTPPYSPDLPSSDEHMFQICVFRDITTDGWLTDLDLASYKTRIIDLEKIWNKCIELQRGYVQNS